MKNLRKRFAQFALRIHRSLIPFSRLSISITGQDRLLFSKRRPDSHTNPKGIVSLFGNCHTSRDLLLPPSKAPASTELTLRPGQG